MNSRAILLGDSVLTSFNLILVFREGLNALRDTIPLKALRNLVSLA